MVSIYRAQNIVNLTLFEGMARFTEGSSQLFWLNKPIAVCIEGLEHARKLLYFFLRQFCVSNKGLND